MSTYEKLRAIVAFIDWRADNLPTEQLDASLEKYRIHLLAGDMLEAPSLEAAEALARAVVGGDDVEKA